MDENKKRGLTNEPGNWLEYTKALNEEKSPEECGFDLTDEEKEIYLRDLAWLKKERAAHPDVPIMFDSKYTDIE